MLDEQAAPPHAKRARLTSGVVDGVKTKDGRAPEWWWDESRSTWQTNVTNVLWNKQRKRWQVSWVDTAGKLRQLGRVQAFNEACAMRRGVEDNHYIAGLLIFKDDGVAQVTKCAQCCKPGLLMSFAPAPCCNNARIFDEFVNACIQLASTDPEVVSAAELIVNRLRTVNCRRCRDAKRRSALEGNGVQALCLRAAQDIRTDMAKRGCAKCSETRAECYECDHPGRVDKEQGVLESAYWADQYGRNGPAMMWREYAKCTVLCRCCHMLENTHSGARATDSTHLPNGSKKQQIRQYAEEKYAYVNRIKRERFGQCFYCGPEMQCNEGNERAFQFMHRDQLDKALKISNLCKATSTLKTCKPLLDAEIAKCRLGCANCHWIHETLPSQQIDNAKWDALEARWVGKLCR